MAYLGKLTAFAFATLIASQASAFDTLARSAMIVDQTTGTVLLAKDADRPVPPASMSKLMTLHMLFEALRDGRVAMDTKFLVSERATKLGGSTMFLRAGERVTVRDLIQGIIVQSGNDACITVAENIAGTEEAFAQQMTVRASELGMTSSTFGNSTGWPDPNQRMSARDLVYLANRIIIEFPNYYPFFAQTSFTWDGVEQANRNPLLSLGIGADGLKTGHTTEAGYGLVGSAKQGNRRIIFMITGLETKSARASEAEKLTNWAFRQFVSKDLFPKGEQVADAQVWLGQDKTVGLVAEKEISGLFPLGSLNDVKIEVSYTGPVEAPIKQGDRLATLTVSAPNIESSEHVLVAANDVPNGSLMSRVLASAELLGTDLIGGKFWARD
jgi:D-alanyl-D-alanine carboxypeptidase (penicillin-binding protein 5/6)